MKHSGKRKRIFYSSGLFSLILIPTLCFCYIANNFKTEKVYAINNIFLTSGMAKRNPAIISEDFMKERIYLKQILKGNAIEKGTSVHAVLKQIKDLVAKKDTIHGIEVSFTESATYKEFIQILDFCKVNEVKNQFVYNGRIYVFVPNKIRAIRAANPKNEGLHPCGGSFSCGLVVQEPVKAKTSVEYFKLPSQEIMQKLWPLGCVYAWLVFLTFRRKRIHQ